MPAVEGRRAVPIEAMTGGCLLSVRGGRVVRLATFTDRAEAAESRRGYLSSERPFADDGGGRSSVRRYPGLPVDKIVTV